MTARLVYLEPPCTACGRQLVHIDGCVCGCKPVTFCTYCRWVDTDGTIETSTDLPPKDTADE